MNCPIPDNLKPNMSKAAALDMVLEAIATEKPFAFTKYGDGESILLQTLLGRPPEYQATEPGVRTPKENFEALRRYYRRIIVHWGVDTLDHMMAVHRICDPILDSLIHSDLLGLHHGIPDFFRTSDYKGCSERIIGCLAHPDKLDDFFQGKSIRLFSNHGSKLLGNVRRRTRSKVTLTTIHRDWTLKEVQTNLELIKDFPEPIVLWGGGAGAKQTGIYLRDKFGKTCIDMGSILDAWAGQSSRQFYKQSGTWQSLVIPD